MLASVYSSARAAKSRYEQLDLSGRTEGAEGPKTVSLLYEELQRSIDIVRVVITKGGAAGTHPQTARALSILAALEGGLDFKAGGELALSLAGVYRSMRRELGIAARDGDLGRIGAIEDGLRSITEAWATVSG